MAIPSVDSDAPKDTIVLTHGFGAHRSTMSPLAWRLQARGFATRNHGYFSLASIGQSYTAFRQRLQELDRRSDTGQIHIVAHSMGCVVTRRALQDYRPRKLGRVVMMTPPSKGSPRADLLAPALGWLVKPLRELQTHHTSLVNRLPEPDYPFGLIRATHDFLVPPDYERLSGAEDELLIRGMHFYVLIAPQVADEIVHYLQTGKFAHRNQTTRETSMTGAGTAERSVDHQSGDTHGR